MTDLQSVIVLSGRCIAAFDAGNRIECRRLIQERDAVYQRLDWTDVAMFRLWVDQRLSPAEVDALLDSEAA